ncbi:phosphotransferase family protein [Paenibacillus allorhizosphaerae]|uniref:Aminoglycoside phosphotransferase domain-containing protein n=1 Tax=Paenibacillus allorhizosphaerae TaxID=2849866 RepID=A0ABN7TT29_9BACL|nr:aminoglycoside phosphotransferase family protein [Paenibacillus allorhizosphaerae]CAG7654788.1 hypothetical protein PAECIP111802_05877 [Paenibacillus allorhizosphaerae]
MKEGWERPEAPVSIDLRQLNEMIQPAFPGKRVTAAERIGTGFSNSNYKIYLEGIAVPFVFRLFSGDGEVADKELAISRLVRKTVPVADFIYADSSCSAFGKPWAVLEWKEGVLLRDVFRTGTSEEMASAAASVGSILAHIHAFMFPEAGFFGKDLTIRTPFRMNGDHFISFIENSLFHNRCGRWLGEELTQAVWSFCRKYGPCLSESGETPVLAHSDFNGLNILMRRETTGYSVAAVLDWEFAFAWSRNVDIANMLRYEEDGSAFEHHFIWAYLDQGARLESNWKLLAKLEDLIALCDMLNHSSKDTPNRICDLQRLIAGTVQTFR